MKIIVLSDTHIPKTAPDLPKKIYAEIASADLVLHAGDFVEVEFLNKLKKILPVRAVCGNMDTDELKKTLPQKDIIKIGKFRIGLIHGWGAPTKLIEVISKEFSRVDAIVFGHSHIPTIQKVKNTLFFNPGTPTDKVFAAYNSYGILEIGKELTGTIVRI